MRTIPRRPGSTFVLVLTHPIVLVLISMGRRYCLPGQDRFSRPTGASEAKEIDEDVLWIAILGIAGLGLIGAVIGSMGFPNLAFGPVNMLAFPMAVWAGHLVGWFGGEWLTARRAARSKSLGFSDVWLHGSIGWLCASAILLIP